MGVEPGQSLAHYRLEEKIGQGGMGQVWRAIDTSLERPVAIKILPDAFADSPERLARFDREAKLIASLNHPGIASVHGLLEHEGTRFLVMELVPGEDLASCLRRGALPVHEALDVARRLAEALQAAHDSQIVHRDLKPANVQRMPDGQVKVLDFGLAKGFETDVKPTLTTPAPSAATVTSVGSTVPGVVLGTAAYMSPEQARGRPVDRKTDVWAFGCILYEMLTGRLAFFGETVSDMLAAVLKTEPDWEALPPDVPPSVERLIRRCLRKEARQRLHDVGDARLVLEDTLAGRYPEAVPAASETARRSLPPWLFVAAIAAVAMIAMWVAGVPERGKPEPLHLSIPIERPLDGTAGASAVLAPDGRSVVLAARDADGRRLYLRSLTDGSERALPGTEGGKHPFFSPDGRWIGFFAENELRRVSVSGGPPVGLCGVESDRGGVWRPDGTIFFAPTEESAIWAIDADGGEPSPVTTLDSDRGERSHRWPALLPGGDSLLITVEEASDMTFDEADLALVDLGSGKHRVVLSGGSQARYVEPGHLIYANDGRLLEVPFDARKGETTGPPAVALEEVVYHFPSGGAQFSLSESGHLAYLSDFRSGERRIVRLGRDGVPRTLDFEPRKFATPRLSPEGKRLAIQVDRELWIYDLEHGTPTRLTLEAGVHGSPVWTPDGEEIYFASIIGALTDDSIFRVPASGAPRAVRVTEGTSEYPVSFSPGGRWLSYDRFDPETDWDIWILDLEAGSTEPLLRTGYAESSARFSPDGHWLAYTSNESGRDEIYVRAYPENGGPRRISTDGGTYPIWGATSEELYYRTPSEIMVVSLETSPTLEWSRPRVAFAEPHPGTGREDYDVFPDGGGILWLESEAASSLSPRPRMVLDWSKRFSASR